MQNIARQADRQAPSCNKRGAQADQEPMHAFGEWLAFGIWYANARLAVP
jgi:hypothetical protein